MGETILLKNCRYVLTMDENFNLLESQDLLIEDGRIECVGECGDRSGTVIDCSGMVIMPGLSDSLCHVRDLFLGLDVLELAAHPFEELKRLRGLLSERAGREAVELYVLEALLSGVTHSAIVLDRKEDADIGYPLRVTPVMEIRDAEDFRRFLSSRFEYGYVEQDRLVEISSQIDLYGCALGGKKVICEASISRRDIFKFRDKTGMFPVEWLSSRGMLTDDLILAGIGWVTSWEVGMLAERRARVLIFPLLDAYILAGSFVPLKELLSGGVVIGLGSYTPKLGLASNLFSLSRILLAQYRSNYWSLDLTPREVLCLASAGGYRVYGIRGGAIKEGNRADLIGLDYARVGLPGVGIYTSILMRGDGCVSLSLVDGRVALEEDRRGELLEKVEELKSRIGRVILMHDSERR